jgi:hypothetical protein
MMFLQVPLVLGESTINDEFFNTAILLGLKGLFVIAGFLFIAFSIVVIRQITIMQQTVVTPIAGRIKLLGYALLAVSVAAGAYYLFVL